MLPNETDPEPPSPEFLSFLGEVNGIHRSLWRSIWRLERSISGGMTGGARGAGGVIGGFGGGGGRGVNGSNSTKSNESKTGTGKQSAITTPVINVTAERYEVRVDQINDFSLLGMYWQFQVGGGMEYGIRASSLDFSGTSQAQLGLVGMKPGDMKNVNLFNAGINPISLAFGKVTLTYAGNYQLYILPDRFDFNIEWQNGLTWGNIGTFLGAAVNYNLPGLLLGSFSTPLYFGGPFNVFFYGTTTIHR